MSHNNFKELMKIFSDFKFSFVFSEVEKGKDRVNGSDYNFTRSKLTVNYGDVGSFTFPVEYIETENPGKLEILNNNQLLSILEVLSTSTNLIEGTIPEKLTDLMKGEKVEKEKPIFKVTGKNVYFDVDTFQIVTGDIDLTNDRIFTGKEILVHQVDGFKFVKHDRVGVGYSIVYDGFLISCGTNEYKQDFPKKNPLTYFIEKFNKLRPEDRGKLLSDCLKRGKEELKKVQELRKKGKTPSIPSVSTVSPVPKVETVQSTGKKENPVKGPKIDPVKVQTSKLTKLPLITRVRGENPDIWDSWDGSNIVSGKGKDGHPFVTFTVNGFLYQGKIKVTENLKTGLYTVQSFLKDNKTIVKEFEKVVIERLTDTIDRIVEYPGDDSLYFILVEQMERDFLESESEKGENLQTPSIPSVSTVSPVLKVETVQSTGKKENPVKGPKTSKGKLSVVK